MRNAAARCEIKKQRYVYYHCIGYWDKCRGNPASCRRKYVREEALEARFTELLSRLNFDDEVLEWCARHCTPATPTSVVSTRSRSNGITLGVVDELQI